MRKEKPELWVVEAFNIALEMWLPVGQCTLGKLAGGACLSRWRNGSTVRYRLVRYTRAESKRAARRRS